MSDFSNYKSKYSRIHFERGDDGILLMRFHTNGGPLQWSIPAHQEFEDAFAAVADDADNRVVIMTGTGDEFSGPLGAFASSGQLGTVDAVGWDRLRKGGKDLLLHLLRIEVPVIAAVNGPAVRHAEMPLLSDIVIASETASFQDTAHFVNRTPPGDGQHVIMPLAMGINRARYYLLTGQSVSAAQALQYGLVSEVLPRDRVLDRAYELARMVISQPPIVVRNTRLILTQQIKSAMQDYLEYGLNLEGLGVIN